jgi:hypothetical protein
MHPACQIEFEYGASGNTVRCGKSVAAECVDCGNLICDACRTGCCGQSFCHFCIEHHLAHSCLRTSTKGKEAQRATFGNENAA